MGTLWCVFDLDDTIIRNELLATPNTPNSVESYRLEPFRDTQRALDFLKQRQIPVALASFRTNAPQVLREHGLLEHFDAVRYTLDRQHDQRTKFEMIQELAQELSLSPYHAVFFDDLPENVEDCNNRLIYTVAVEPTVGVTLELLFDSLFAALRSPCYILSRTTLPTQEIANYLEDYRVVFLTCNPSVATARRIAETDRSPVVLLWTPGTLDLFHRDNHVRVSYPNFYESLDAGLHQLQGLSGAQAVPQSLGNILDPYAPTSN